MTQRKQGQFKNDNLQNSGCKRQQTWLKWKLNTHVLATTPNRPVSRRRRKHDSYVLSNIMRNIAQIMTSRPVEVAVAPNVARVHIPASTPYVGWVGSLLCSERFFFGYSGFPLSPKTNIFKFQFDQESGGRKTTLRTCHLQIIICLLQRSFTRGASPIANEMW